ncbi:Ig-like domain-containing protein, partial [Singulisphaera rosea]
GSSGFGASTSAGTAVTINALATSNVLTLLTSSSISVGQAAKFSATVSNLATGAVPTGTIIFLDGSTLLATVALSNGTATFATSSLTYGVHNIVAIFIGTSNYQGGSSNSVSVSVS